MSAIRGYRVLANVQNDTKIFSVAWIRPEIWWIMQNFNILFKWRHLRRFTGDFFKQNFLLKFMKNILQYTIDYPNVIYRKKLGVTNSGF